MPEVAFVELPPKKSVSRMGGQSDMSHSVGYRTSFHALFLSKRITFPPAR